jgi:glycosyltransferase involved in cell wall biosynthesis
MTIKKIAILNYHPVQYFAPLYEILTKKNLNINVIYTSKQGIFNGLDRDFNQKFKWDIDLLKGYSYKFLDENSILNKYYEIWKIIKNGKYDAIWVHGYSHLTHIFSILIAKCYGIPVLIRGETHLGLTKSKIRWYLHKKFLKIFFKNIDRLLAIGSKNYQYYVSLGIAQEKIFLTPYSVDNKRFSGEGLTDEQLKNIRKRYEINCDDMIVLFSSKFTERKRAIDLLKAVKLLKEKNISVNYTVLMVGQGEEYSNLEDFVLKNKLENVKFLGFRNQAELPDIYAISDIFVLPSMNEPWGLVVNEAMCSASAIIVTDEVGCSSDLVRDGQNGYIYSAGSVPGLTECLEKIISDKEKVRQFRRESKKIINEWGYEQTSQGLINALESLNGR